jgi:hypothetical protein
MLGGHDARGYQGRHDGAWVDVGVRVERGPGAT